MMEKFTLRFALLYLALSASPALAGDGAQVPEASAMTLFALGVLGVIVGRSGGRRPLDRKSDDKRES